MEYCGTYGFAVVPVMALLGLIGLAMAGARGIEGLAPIRLMSLALADWSGGMPLAGQEVRGNPLAVLLAGLCCMLLELERRCASADIQIALTTVWLLEWGWYWGLAMMLLFGGDGHWWNGMSAGLVYQS